MEKTIDLGGKKTTLRANAMNLIVYQEAFGEDMFEAKDKLLKAFGNGGMVVGAIPSVTVLRMLWTMARCYDKDIPPFNDWIEGLDEIPIVDIYNENLDLFLSNMLSNTDIKNPKATVSGKED